MVRTEAKYQYLALFCYLATQGQLAFLQHLQYIHLASGPERSAHRDHMQLPK